MGLITTFADLQQFSFDGLIFPVSEIEITGGGRTHVHEYPHSPGGAVEKLGRKLYEFRVQALFHNGFPSYPGLFTTVLNAVRTLSEGQDTRQLVIPHIGTIDAYIDKWSETAKFKSSQSGVSVSITFLEDSQNDFLVDALVQTAIIQIVDVGKNFASLIEIYEDVTLDQIGGPLELQDFTTTSSLFDAIGQVTATLGSIQDQRDLYDNFFSAKLAQLQGLCQAVDETFGALDNPVNAELLRALHDLQYAAIVLDESSRTHLQQVDSYIVPRTMSVSEAARAIYRDASRGGDLLGLNDIHDPFAVPAGATLRYFRDAA